MNENPPPPDDTPSPLPCPACGNQLLIPPSLRGMQVMCPHTGCGQVFTVPAAEPPPVPAAAPPPPSHPAKAHALKKKTGPGPTRTHAAPRPPSPSASPKPSSPSAPPPARNKQRLSAPVVSLLIILAILGLLAILKPAKKPRPAAAPPPAAVAAAPAVPATTAPPKPRARRGEMTDEDRAKFNQTFTKFDEETKEKQRKEFESILTRAAGGDKRVQTQLGNMYLHGEGTSPDAAKAREWLEKAAAQEYPEAYFSLAELNTRENDPKAAAKNYLQAGKAAVEDYRKEDPHAEEIVNRALYQLAILRAVDEYRDLLTAITGQDVRLVGSGTGWFIDQQNLVTCHHVIEAFDPEQHRLFIQSDIIPKTEVTVVKSNAENDVAVLKLPEPLKTVKGIRLATKEATLGASAFTIGYPHIGALGKAPKFNDGKISALTGMEDKPRDYTISVPVQPGNSGGPLFNKRGEAIGVIVAQMRFMQNVNYAVKLEHLKTLLDEINWKPSGEVITQEAADMEEAVPLVQSSWSSY
ncbi:MAG: tetratricopeptide repeat-containing serine protease family protein [Kiritimatiellia bacterium]